MVIMLIIVILVFLVDGHNADVECWMLKMIMSYFNSLAEERIRKGTGPVSLSLMVVLIWMIIKVLIRCSHLWHKLCAYICRTGSGTYNDMVMWLWWWWLSLIITMMMMVVYDHNDDGDDCIFLSDYGELTWGLILGMISLSLPCCWKPNRQYIIANICKTDCNIF